jgi:hypothetical protein
MLKVKRSCISGCPSARTTSPSGTTSPSDKVGCRRQLLHEASNSLYPLCAIETGSKAQSSKRTWIGGRSYRSEKTALRPFGDFDSENDDLAERFRHLHSSQRELWMHANTVVAALCSMALWCCLVLRSEARPELRRLAPSPARRAGRVGQPGTTVRVVRHHGGWLRGGRPSHHRRSIGFLWKSSSTP